MTFNDLKKRINSRSQQQTQFLVSYGIVYMMSYAVFNNYLVMIIISLRSSGELLDKVGLSTCAKACDAVLNESNEHNPRLKVIQDKYAIGIISLWSGWNV
jgi:hypothetical protein